MVWKEGLSIKSSTPKTCSKSLILDEKGAHRLCGSVLLAMICSLPVSKALRTSHSCVETQYLKNCIGNTDRQNNRQLLVKIFAFPT